MILPAELTLFPFQIESIDWLTKKRVALLSLDMGLGKTIVTIRSWEKLGLTRILVICPSIARFTWAKEIVKWSGEGQKIQILMKRTDTPDPDTNVLICSFDYASIPQDKKLLRLTKKKTPAFNPKLISWRKDLLVVDESHFLKSLDARRTQAVLSSGALIHSSPRTWFLTGTPMPNAPHELWPMMRAFGATDLNYDAFIHAFCETYEFNGKKVVCGSKRARLPELRELLAPIMLRRMKKDVLKDLPPLMVSDFFVDAKLTDMPEISDGHRELLRILSITDPLEQMRALEVISSSIATLRRFCGLQKVTDVCELIEEELKNNAYQKIVIFCVHKEVIKRVLDALKAYSPVAVHGEVSADQRQKNIEAFQINPSVRVFVGNIAAAGTNITLTAAHQMMFIEEDFVPGNNKQAIDRCNRIGQTMPVHVRRARLADSMDDRINEILFRKSGDIKLLLGAM